MKKTPANTSETKLPPVFPNVLHTPVIKPKPAAPAKRDNIFSKSRDNREDRGERQMKTSQNTQTSHGRK